MSIILYHKGIEQDEFPSPNSTNEPGLHIAGTRLLKYTEEEGITHVVIPDTITEIDRDCFKNCRRLKSIVIPDSVTLIGAGAFADCFSLETVNLPSGILALGDSLFQNCYMLREIDIPKSTVYRQQGFYELPFSQKHQLSRRSGIHRSECF